MNIYYFHINEINSISNINDVFGGTIPFIPLYQMSYQNCEYLTLAP